MLTQRRIFFFFFYVFITVKFYINLTEDYSLLTQTQNSNKQEHGKHAFYLNENFLVFNIYFYIQRSPGFKNHLFSLSLEQCIMGLRSHEGRV